MSRSNLKVKLRRIGTGQGFLISSAVCRLMGIKVGDELIMEFDGFKIILRNKEGK